MGIAAEAERFFPTQAAIHHHCGLLPFNSIYRVDFTELTLANLGPQALPLTLSYTASIGTGLAVLTYGFPVSLGTPLLSARGQLVGLVTGPGPVATAGAVIRLLLTP